MKKVVDECSREMDRQYVLWGVQNHPSVRDGMPAEQQSYSYIGMSSTTARELVEKRAELGSLTYADIAIEELAEALDAPTEEERRAELVQLMAVIGNWVRVIDLRKRHHKKYS